ncbi:MAG: hypothetical protein P8J27_12645 [Mariniblastus sp.]|nr:hypothetical protein [Mariniblastus sp.]
MSSGYEFVGGGTRDLAWINSTGHRNQIRMLIESATQQKSNPTLCVLGAGACNDLDLPSLLGIFSQITLVDLDGESVQRALEKRQLAPSNQISLVSDLDVSGVYALLKQYGEHPSAELLAKIKRVVTDVKLSDLQQYDVIVSTCMLSQLQNHVFENCQNDDESLAELLALTRRRHLQLLVEHTNPGGSAILVTDVTSSEALPELAGDSFEVSESSWQKIVQGNHFHGMSPLGINRDFDHDEQLQRLTEKTMTSRPWIWNATERLYACIAYYMSVKK